MIGVEVLRLDDASDDHNQDHGVFVKPQQFVSLNCYSRLPRLDCEGCVIGQPGCQRNCSLHDGVKLVLLLPHGALKLRYFALGEIVSVDEPVDVKAVTGFRWDTSCGCVGLFEITQLLKLCHFVSDCSRRAGDLLILHQGFGTNRLSVTYVRIDNRLQYELLSFAQIASVFRQSLSPLLCRWFST